MSEMIERVAMALAEESGVSSWANVPEYGEYDSREYWRRLAVRAIGALRTLRAESKDGDQAMREALKVAEQALLEVHGAQVRGEDWYTQGRSGLYQQVAMWVAKGRSAITAALTLDAVRDKPE